MPACRLLLLSLLLWSLTGARCWAHFLFAYVGPPAEGGRAVEVYFSELAEAGDPRFIDKIAGTQLWQQTVPGKFEPLKVHKAADRLRAWLPSSGSLQVVGEFRYGVLARPNATPFLLRHYPKALAGKPDELNRLENLARLPLEIQTRIEGDTLHFTALRLGKPLPGTEFITIDAQLNNVKITGDKDGRVSWKPPAPGKYAVYTRHTSKETGEVDGKKFEEIRDFATVSFSWPLERTGADPEAVALFQDALAARAAWKDFPGFSADISGNLEGRPFAGSVTIDAKGAVRFLHQNPAEAEAVGPWVQEQLESIVLHRGARANNGDRTVPVLRFAEGRAEHPFGRLLIFEGGRFASSYRVKDRQILVVNRAMGKLNMTITVLENDRNAEGLFLPRSYQVQYWDAATGDLQRTETIQQRWQRVGDFDLPAQHTVSTANAAGLSVRTFTLTRFELPRKP